MRYEGAEDNVLKNLTFELVQGERVFLHGENGCGKSTLIKTILQQVNMRQTGYGSQDMQQTRENMQLDMECVQFAKRLEEFSEGQKKKVLIAASLMTPAHVYIWDEPLNYIDVFSRMQIEQLILRYQPTMILVDHDIRFQEKIATRVVEL